MIPFALYRERKRERERERERKKDRQREREGESCGAEEDGRVLPCSAFVPSLPFFLQHTTHDW